MTRRNIPVAYLSLILVCILFDKPVKTRAGNLQPAQLDQANKLQSYDPKLIEAGNKLFMETCSVCHGVDGKGSARGPDLIRGMVVTRGTDDEVFQVIRKGVPGSSMAAFDLPDLQIHQLVAFIRALSTPAAQVSVPGDLESGQRIFFGKGRCSECHMIRGRGGLLGPDLSNIGGERTLLEIRESILKLGPSSLNKYRGVTVVTRDAERINGTLRNRDDFSLQIMDRAGKFHFLLISELRKMILREKSLMPSDIASLLSTEELQNLLAFLSRQAVTGGNQIEGRRKRAR